MYKPEQKGGVAALGFSRAYSLSLSPQIIHTRSNLLPALVASRVYRQLEFLAVGTWFVGNTSDDCEGFSLRKVPSSREDVVDDTKIDLRSKRNVMRFLQLATDPEKLAAVVADVGTTILPTFLTSSFNIPTQLHPPLFALTLSPEPLHKTSVAYALPMIHRHLTSIGMFGPGFGAVIPKWGGLSEVAQVACRAGAVGGGVYVLGKGIKVIETVQSESPAQHGSKQERALSLRLSGGESINTTVLVGSQYDLPGEVSTDEEDSLVVKSITIVSSPLQELFPSPMEGAAPSSAAIVVLPQGTRSQFLLDNQPDVQCESPPIYLKIHLSDTGECPHGQCTFI